MDDFAAVVTYGGATSFSPDGTQLAVINNRSGQYNIWLQPLAGGEQTQLTFYTDNAVRDLSWSPDGKQILYTADYQGNEKHQLFHIPPGGGEPEALTKLIESDQANAVLLCMLDVFGVQLRLRDEPHFYGYPPSRFDSAACQCDMIKLNKILGSTVTVTVTVTSSEPGLS